MIMNVEILDLDRQRSLYDSEYPVQLTCACKCTWTLVPSLEILCPIVKIFILIAEKFFNESIPLHCRCGKSQMLIITGVLKML